MTGVFLIIVALVWLIIVLWLIKQITKKIQSHNLKIAIALILIPLFLVLPVMDEIIGKIQFQQICEEKSALQIKEEKIKSKSVRMVIAPSWQAVKGTAIPINYSSFSYLDAETNEEYASYSIVRVEGGLLIRLFGISEGNAPLLMNRTSCSPQMSVKTLAKKFQFHLIDS